MTSTSNLWLEKVTSLAISNKYTKWYISIISKALDRSTTRESANALLGYVEGHHIIPKCFKLGGEKDKSNIAYLTAREHFICHWLLTKMFNGLYKKFMYCAMRQFTRAGTTNRILTSIQYDAVRRMWVERMKTFPTNAGKMRTEEQRGAMSKRARENSRKFIVWENDKIIEQCIDVYTFAEKYNCKSGQIIAISVREFCYYKDWIFDPVDIQLTKDQYDKIRYRQQNKGHYSKAIKAINIITNEVFEGRCIEFLRKLKIIKSTLQILNSANYKYKQWIIIDPNDPLSDDEFNYHKERIIKKFYIFPK